MSAPRIGTLEIAALLAVARLGADAYGPAVRRDLAERTGRDQSVGAVYTTLQRLEDKGLLTSRVGDPLPVRGGRSALCAHRRRRARAPGRRAAHRVALGRRAIRHSSGAHLMAPIVPRTPTPGTGSPTVAERLLQAIGADPVFAEVVLGDLAEEFALRAARDGVVAARWWYTCEALRSAPHLIRSWLRHA